MERTDFQVGQKVLIYGDQYGRRREPVEGEVVKVGRTLVHVRTGDSKWQPEGSPFRMETGYARDEHDHRRVRTLEQAADDERCREAWATLNRHGLTAEHHRATSISTDVLVQIATLLDAGGA